MPGSYVPPHLRNEGSSATSTASEPAKAAKADNRFTLEEIRDHYFGIDDNATVLNTTLHDSKEIPGQLAFVILFIGANPRWDIDHILFTKSSLELLPSGKADDLTAPGVEEGKAESGSAEAPSTTSQEAGQPLAIFKQVTARECEFEGWYKIANIDILEPNSPELVRMLEQKWTKTKSGKTIQEARSGEGWQRSLALRWAVVKFAKDEGAENERGAPKIERKPKQSVNEMLAQLRVKDVTNQSSATIREVPKTKDVAGDSDDVTEVAGS